MIRVVLFLALILQITPAHSGAAKKIGTRKLETTKFSQWHTTYSIDKFPCMTEKETDFLKRIVDMQKIEQKLVLLADHRKDVKPSPRRPANFSSLNEKKFICPPFRGVRNPYPQVIDFGKAATSERIQISDSFLQVLDGLSKNERWPLNYSSAKGYYEGSTPRGTPVNLIPLVPEKGQGVRFLVQYMLWKDKTPPSLTLCYREDLHNQCNPYKAPEAQKAQVSASTAGRLPASSAKSKP